MTTNSVSSKQQALLPRKGRCGQVSGQGERTFSLNASSHLSGHEAVTSLLGMNYENVPAAK